MSRRRTWWNLIQPALLAVAVVAAPASALAASPRYRLIGFDDLIGWTKDNQRAALAAFVKSCDDISAKPWGPLCKLAKTGPDARQFFELFFLPVVVRPDKTALFTGYFEPILKGSLYRVGEYKYPIYMKPPDLKPKDPGLTRKAIDAGALEHKGLEIAYVNDPVGAYYLHVQGSGRINLTNGNQIQVGYAGENGHIYRSAARELVRRGEIPASQASITGLRNWFRKNPKKGLEALEFNPSYVFFRRLGTNPGKTGPLGALERPLSAGRSLAIDPKYTQLGAPVWIEMGGQTAMRRLMVAQDVGAAIKGPQRADIFFGTGDTAGQRAGKIHNTGRMVELLPIEIANRLVPGS